MTAKSVVNDVVFPIFKFIHAFKNGLVTCKNEEDPSRDEGTRVDKTFLPL